MSKIVIAWNPRIIPLAPVAVVAQGMVVAALTKRLLDGSDAELAELAGVWAMELLIVRSENPTRLPWVDGVTYLGRDSAAPSLLVSTTHQPILPVALVERAIRMRFPALGAPFAILPDGNTVVSLGDCRKPIARATLLKGSV